MTSRLWWVFASAIAWSLAQVIGAPTRTEPLPRPRPALAPVPRRPELPRSTREPVREPECEEDWLHPDRLAGSLVRPYMSGAPTSAPGRGWR